MTPDFLRSTIETISKRAAFICSNPDCRVNTIGPNTDPNKSTKIGEAAHIFGAREGSKRFKADMNDVSRAAITNAIWLCRNCHKLIDTDEQKYSSNILFKWREMHEEYVASNLGSKTDQISYNNQLSILDDFEEYPPIVKRIIIDKPTAWEYRLTAELMRHINDPLFRKLSDLKDNLYLKRLEKIKDDNALEWVQDRLGELTIVTPPAVGLIERMNISWGKPGEHGDAIEIHHVVKLFNEYLNHIIDLEERIHFVSLPEKYNAIHSMLKDTIGFQVQKLSAIPDELDDIVMIAEEMKDKPSEERRIEKEIVFELPDNWEKKFNRELRKLSFTDGIDESNNKGCVSTILTLFVLSIIISILAC